MDRQRDNISFSLLGESFFTLANRKGFGPFPLERAAGGGASLDGEATITLWQAGGVVAEFLERVLTLELAIRWGF